MSNFEKKYLEKYNKNQIDNKEKFFKDFSMAQYYQLITDLGFTLDRKSENFKVGHRVITPEKTFWISSDNETKKISSFKYNAFSKSFYREEIDARLNKADIKKHCFGSKDKNRKLSLYYKMPSSNKQYETAFVNLYNCNKKIYGTTIKLNTNILFFDLDQHNDEEKAINKLKKLFEVLHLENKDVLFIEQNIFNGGLHLAIKVPFKIKNKEFYSKLKKELKNQNVEVDCNFYNTILRLPLSYEYNPLNINLIDFNKEYQDCFINSFTSFISSIDFNKEVNSSFLNKIYTDTINNEIIKPTQNKYNYWSSNIRVFEPSTLKINIYDKLISAGNRYNNMSLIVPECVQRGLSLEDTATYIMSLDTGSKDLKKWSKNGLIKNIAKYYNQCKLHPRKAKLSNFISNQKYIPEEIIKVLSYPEVMNKLINGLKKEYMNERKKHNNSFNFSNEKLKNINIQFPFIIKEVIGTYYFQIQNQLKKKEKYIDKRFINYDGFQLSDTHIKRIINESRLLDGLSFDSSSFSVQYIKKGIINLLKLSLITLPNKKINWSKGFCKSYVLSLDKIFSFIKSITDSLKGLKNYNLIIKNLFLYINNYILLNNLQGFAEQMQKLEQNWMKNYSINAPPD